MWGNPNEDTDWPEEWLPWAIGALKFRRHDDVGTVLPSSTCHYCGSKATSEDHIVPRFLLPKPLSSLPYWYRSLDVVASCAQCNWLKSHYRSDCTCDQCSWAWNTAVGCGWITRQQADESPIVHVVRSPG